MFPHEILGIRHNSSVKDIKSAYIALAKLHHPDKGGDASFFNVIKSARDAMINDTYLEEIYTPNYSYFGKPYIILYPSITGDGSAENPIMESNSNIEYYRGLTIVTPKGVDLYTKQ